MTDRLPAPVADVARGAQTAERASATKASGFAPEHRRAAPSPAAEGAPRSLGELQRWTVSAITGEEEASAAGIEAVVTHGPRLTAHDRLSIYRHGYTARLVECLVDDYPVLAQTLGDRFEALCRAYIARHPSGSPSLNAFGRLLPGFCLETAVDLPCPAFASELASLEWALVEAVHAEAPPPLDLRALQAIPFEAWGRAHLVRSETVRLLELSYPVNDYYQASLTGEGLPEVPGPSPTATAVYRHGLELWRLGLTPAMARVLGALLAGAPITEALALIGADDADPEALAEAERSVSVWFREWVDSGFFAGVTVDDPPDGNGAERRG